MFLIFESLCGEIKSDESNILDFSFCYHLRPGGKVENVLPPDRRRNLNEVLPYRTWCRAGVSSNCRAKRVRSEQIIEVKSILTSITLSRERELNRSTESSCNLMSQSPEFKLSVRIVTGVNCNAPILFSSFLFYFVESRQHLKFSLKKAFFNFRAKRGEVKSR